ncbi:MAG: hypothetical protein WKF54_14060 [Nocardioidaceae bacterium]
MRQTTRLSRRLLIALVALVCVATAYGGALPAQGSSAPPAAAAAAAPGLPFFGTWSDGLSMTSADSQRELGRQHDAGVGLVRQYIWWNRMEKSPGVYDWSRMDQLVTDAKAKGMQILPTLLYTPDFYSSKPADSTSTAQFPPADPQKLANFASKMVDRYGTDGTYWCKPLLPNLPPECPTSYKPITYWEVWNEPDYTSWWKGSPNPAEYLELLKVTSTAIRAADPDAQVVLGSLTGAGGSLTDGYLDALYQLGAKDYFDVVSLNPYGRDVGAMVAYIRGQRAVMDSYGDSAKPTIITEYGWATGGRSDNFVVEPQCQAALMYAGTKRLYDLQGELNILAAIQFQWHDVATTTDSWPHYAGMYYADDRTKPSLEAYTAATAGDPTPQGMTLAESCPADRQNLDGRLTTLTFTTSGQGSGVVTSRPSGVACPGSCSHEYAPGTAVTLTATPAEGSGVVGWKGAACSGTTCTVTMDASKAVEAVFERKAAPGTYQQTSKFVSQTGSWRRSASDQDSGGSSAYTTDGPADATMTFEGTGVTWVSRKTAKMGIGRVFLDGVRVADIDGYSAITRYQTRLFDSGVLEAGQHTIRIQFTGRKRAAATDNNLVLDAFIVR